jgi:hypothetical protein
MIRISILIAFSQMMLMGCGAHSNRPTAKEAASLGETASPSLLGLKIVKSGADPAYPDFNAVSAETDQVATEDESFFKNVISLDDKAAFLVWSESAMGSAIREAFFEHRVQSVLNHISGEVDRVAASFDEKTRNWFIPILKLLNGNISNANPNDVHLLNLDLFLANSDRVRVKVRLRFRGPLPKIALVQLGGDNRSLSIKEYILDAEQNGKRLLTERITNPTTRHFQLWYRATNAIEVFSLDLGLFSPAQNKFRYSRAFYLDKVVVESNRHELRTYKVSGEWTKLDLAPNETITLNWWTFPHARGGECKPPGEQFMFPALSTQITGASLSGLFSHEVVFLDEENTVSTIYGGTQHIMLQQAGTVDIVSKSECEGVIKF